MNSSIRNIIITGANGFVGSSISQYLSQKEYKIFEVSRYPIPNQVFSYSELDDLIFKNKIDCIIHTAGKAHDLKNVTDPDEYYNINTKLTIEIYNKFKNSNIKKFIYFSSIKAVVDHAETIITEDTVENPQSHYGKSKLLSERYIIQNQPSDKERKTIILRPCIIHGKGNKGNLNLLVDFIEKGIPYPLGIYQNKRSFLSVDNLLFIIEKLLITDFIESGIYNLADDNELSTNQLVKLIAEVRKKKLRILKINKFVIRVFSKVGDIIGFKFNSENVSKLTQNYVISNRKILKMLHLEQMPKDLETSLKETIQQTR